MLADAKTDKTISEYPIYWLCGLVIAFSVAQILFSFSTLNVEILYKYSVRTIFSFCFCLIIIATIRIVPERACHILKYALFFSISITSLLGLTKTLTGSHAESDHLILFGLSFYTASIAYLVANKRLTSRSTFLVSNPLLLITGPMATYTKSMRHWSFLRRFRYFFPYIILGVFLHQAIATPLTNTFSLISLTDAVSSITFAVIFELFVYANFCGLSLAIYGVFGILGLKIPLNFRQPFSATNLVDFWRGWHTSLSSILKDLFYVPTRRIFGTFAGVSAVFLSSAMWHGVTVNFILWGCFHAIFFILSVKLLRRAIPFVPVILMVIGVVIGRLLFADSDTDRLLTKLLFDYDGFGVLEELRLTPNSSKLALLIITLFVGVEFFFQKHRLFRNRTYKFYRIPIVQLVLLVITLSLIMTDSGIDFAVYGQR